MLYATVETVDGAPEIVLRGDTWALREQLKAIPDACWNPRVKAWLLPANPFSRDVLRESGLELRWDAQSVEPQSCFGPVDLRAKAEEWTRSPSAAAWLSNLGEQRPLYAHQRVGVIASRVRDRLILADEMGCIAGETEITINRAGGARRKSLRDFHESVVSGSYDPAILSRVRSLCDGELRLNEVLRSISQGARHVWRLVLASGKQLRLTPDHEVATPNGWVPAKDLRPGDLVLTNGQIGCSECGSTQDVITYQHATFRGLCRACMYRRRTKPKGGIASVIDKDGYVRLYNRHDHPRANPAGQVYEHIVVLEEKLGRGLLPGEQVHHVNEDRADNRPENLHLVSTSEHHHLHGKHRHMDGGTAGRGGQVRFFPLEDRVVSCEPDGETDVYDLVMQDPHRNFVANGIVVHNCGKTATAIEAFCLAARLGEVRRCLVLCPSSLRAPWRREVNLVATVGAADVAVVEQNPPKWTGRRVKAQSDKAHRAAAVERRATWTICHFPVVRLHVEELAALVEGEFLVVDEATSPGAIKDWGTACAKAVATFRPRQLLLMTGTPVADRPEDLHGLCRLASSGLLGRTTLAFRRRYCVERTIKVDDRDENGAPVKREVHKVVGYRNLDDLRERAASVMLRRTKAETLDLPPKVRQERVVELEGAQVAAYVALRDELRAQYMDAQGRLREINVATALAQLLRLQQVADGYGSIGPSSEGWFEPAAKVEAALELVREEVGVNGRKAVVWTRFVPANLRLAHECREAGLPTHALRGEHGQADRDRTAQEFCACDGPAVLVAQLQCAGFGLNLQAADLSIFFDRWWAPATNVQAEDRLHRIGQERPVDIVVLKAQDTVDERLDAVLRRKAEWAAAATGDEPEGKEVASGQDILDLLG